MLEMQRQILELATQQAAMQKQVAAIHACTMDMRKDQVTMHALMAERWGERGDEAGNSHGAAEIGGNSGAERRGGSPCAAAGAIQWRRRCC